LGDASHKRYNWIASILERLAIGGSMKTWGRARGVVLFVSFVATTACSDKGNDSASRDGGSSTGGERNAICAAGDSGREVQEPIFIDNLGGQTSWYASPVIATATTN
jgi:hypothetical protein